jgi:glutaredoxin
MATEPTVVPGKDMGKVMIFAISTCGWCKKTKRFFQEQGVGYQYIDVDTVPDEERESIKDEVRRWNPRSNYPTIVINDSECVVGYDEDKIKAVLGL